MWVLIWSILAILSIGRNNIKLTMVTAKIWQCSDITNGQVNQTFLEEKSKAVDETITKTVVNIHHSLPTNLMCLK